MKQHLSSKEESAFMIVVRFGEGYHAQPKLPQPISRSIAFTLSLGVGPVNVIGNVSRLVPALRPRRDRLLRLNDRTEGGGSRDGRWEHRARFRARHSGNAFRSSVGISKTRTWAVPLSRVLLSAKDKICPSTSA